MRLYLSSYLWGNKPEKILELIGNGPKNAAIITNAADQFPEEGILERLAEDQKFLQNMCITSERLDLRDYFGDRKPYLAERLKKYGFIWVRGANVFVLRMAMRQSGFDELIRPMIFNDEIAYGGFSAGACVMGPSLLGLELVDDVNLTPEGYESETVWEGLNILPYVIVPHYKSDHPESSLMDDVVGFLEGHNMPFKTLHDGEVLVMNGDHEFVEG